MSRFYVDIDGLRRRYIAGTKVCQRIQEDMDTLKADVAALNCDQETCDRLTLLIGKLEKEADNITSVCDYDRYAIERYSSAVEKIDNLTEDIRL